MELIKKDLKITSREIAEITGKNHADVMRDIRSEIESLELEGLMGESIFALSSYKSSQGKDVPIFTMGREGAMQIATRYSAVIRRKLIMRLDELENSTPKLPQTYKEALLELIRVEEEKEQLLIANSKLEEKTKTQHKLIDTMTETYDGTYIRLVCTDYVNKVARESGRHQADLYSDLYKLTGRKLKSDLTVQFEKFVKSEKEKVKANAEYNRENSLKGLDRKAPFLIKDSKAGISKIEFICDVLGKGSVLLEVMAKVFEVGITDIVAKYNIIAESEKIRIEY